MEPGAVGWAGERGQGGTEPSSALGTAGSASGFVPLPRSRALSQAQAVGLGPRGPLEKYCLVEE